MSRARFSPKAKSRSINWELAPESIIQVAGWFSFTVHGNMIGSLDPKSCVEEIEIGAKTGVEAEDTTEDDQTADETAAEEIARRQKDDVCGESASDQTWT